MTPLTIALVVAGAVVAALFLFLVAQVIIARMLLHDAATSRKLRSGAGPVGEADEQRGGGAGRLIRSYAVVVDPAAATARQTATPAQAIQDYVSHTCSGGAVTPLMGTYAAADLSWLVLRRTLDSVRLREDVSAGRIRTLAIMGATVRVWVARKGSSDEDSLLVPLVVAKAGSAKADPLRSQGCVALDVVPPLNGLNTSWMTLKAAIMSASSATVAIHAWGF